MWKNFVKDYLSFTRKDRVGIIVLAALILIVLLLPYCWPEKKPWQPSREELEKIRSEAAELTEKADEPALKEASHSYVTRETSKRKPALFYFDPNTLDAGGWQRLGIREKTAATIINYVTKGGRFRQPEDIGKIYGLFKDDYERLLPFVKIVLPSGGENDYRQNKNVLVSTKREYPSARRADVKIIDINSADTSALIALPGIGSKLAARIINFRDKLGGFYSVQQVGETYGLPDSTFNQIQPMLQCLHATVKQLDINIADANTLKLHPYIRWNLANVIVQYRLQHGNFKSVDDLQLIALITPDVFTKIKPYVVVQ